QEPSRPSARPRAHPAGPSRAVPRSAPTPRGARRRHARRRPPRADDQACRGPLPHHRRLGHAEAPGHRGRGSPRADHAPLRAGEHTAQLEPARRGLGQAPRRRRRRRRAPRSPPPPRPRAPLRAAQLAHEGACKPPRCRGCRMSRSTPRARRPPPPEPITAARRPRDDSPYVRPHADFAFTRTAHPPHLALGGPHAVVPNLVSTPPTPLAGFDPSTYG